MKPSLRYSLIIAGIMIGIGLIMFITGLDMSDNAKIYQYLALVVPIYFLYAAAKEKREHELNGFISYGQAFKRDAAICTISAFIQSMYQILYFKVLNPAMVDRVKEQQLIEFEKQGMSEQQIEISLKYTEMFVSNPALIFISTFLAILIVGLIISLIVAAIVIKDNPNPFAEAEQKLIE